MPGTRRKRSEATSALFPAAGAAAAAPADAPPDDPFADEQHPPGGDATRAAEDAAAGAGTDVPGDRHHQEGEPETPPLFSNMNDPRMNDDFEAIVARVFQIDALPEFERLQRELRIGEDKNRDYASLSNALDKSEDNARVAHKLYVNARVEDEKLRLDVEAIRGRLHEDALLELEAEKEGGTRKKAITNDDVRQRAMANHPVEYKDGELRLVRSRKMVEHVEQLAMLAKSRCETLRTMMTTLRK